jgi:AcrR family transcriptional regulator
MTVTAIARTAGVANRTFYENFQGKEDCFLSTYDLISRNAARGVLAAQRSKRGPQAKITAGTHAFMGAVADNLEAAHFALIAALGVKAAFARTRHTTGLFEAIVTEGFITAPDSIGLPPSIAKGIVAGFNHVATSHLLSRSEGDLAHGGGEMSNWALSLGTGAPGQRLASPRAVESLRDPAAVAGAADGRYPHGNEREAILLAVATLAADEGYGALNLAHVRSSVGTSRRSFDEQFVSMNGCFLAALDLRSSRILAAPSAAALATTCWPELVCRTLAAICDELTRDPMLSRLLFFELPHAGLDGTRWHYEFIAHLSASLFAGAPAHMSSAELSSEASVAAVWELLQAGAIRNPAQQFSHLIGPAAYLVLAPAIGAEAAVAAVGADYSGPGGRRAAA